MSSILEGIGILILFFGSTTDSTTSLLITSSIGIGLYAIGRFSAWCFERAVNREVERRYGR